MAAQSNESDATKADSFYFSGEADPNKNQHSEQTADSLAHAARQARAVHVQLLSATTTHQSPEQKKFYKNSLSCYKDQLVLALVPRNNNSFQTRNEWDEDSVSEMTAACAACASGAFSQQQLFLPRLSRDHIRDRIDIEDSLRIGHRIRSSRVGRWLLAPLL